MKKIMTYKVKSNQTDQNISPSIKKNHSGDNYFFYRNFLHICNHCV